MRELRGGMERGQGGGGAEWGVVGRVVGCAAGWVDGRPRVGSLRMHGWAGVSVDGRVGGRA